MSIIDRDIYLSHISDVEQINNMKRILDLVEIVLRDYSILTTDFLDPYAIKLARSILNRFPDIGYTVFGAYEEAERKIVIIYPDYHYLTEEDLNLKALRLKGDMEGLSHRDFLGSILGLGVSRDRIGDILLSKSYADLVVKSEIVDFIKFNLEKVGNKNFRVEEVDFSQLIYIEEEYREVYKTLSSPRLDVFISGAYNLSRKDSQAIINSKKVKVNFEPIDKTSYEIEEGDLVSVRGYGRAKLYSIEGLSRKDKLKVNIRILL